nr:MAG TPA: hypothetical protein [Caudoviricetes sp.]
MRLQHSNCIKTRQLAGFLFIASSDTVIKLIKYVRKLI